MKGPVKVPVKEPADEPVNETVKEPTEADDAKEEEKDDGDGDEEGEEDGGEALQRNHLVLISDRNLELFPIAVILLDCFWNSAGLRRCRGGDFERHVVLDARVARIGPNAARCPGHGLRQDDGDPGQVDPAPAGGPRSLRQGQDRLGKNAGLPHSRNRAHLQAQVYAA